MAWDIEHVAGPYEGPADGPVWDGEALLFALVVESRIVRYHPATGRVAEHRRYTGNTTGLAFGRDGRLYGCQTSGQRVVRFDVDGSMSMLAERLDGRLHNQPDDLAVDAAGRIWFTDPAPAPGSGWVPAPIVMEPPVDHASVLRLERDDDGAWRIRRMTFDTVFPTGIALSHDEQTLYVAENPDDGARRSELRAYPIVADGTLGSPTILESFEAGSGVQGMCLDADGDLVACLGSAIAVFSPTGELLEHQPFGPARPTNCAFGDPGLDALYVTAEDGRLCRIANTGRRGLRSNDRSPAAMEN